MTDLLVQTLGYIGQGCSGFNFWVLVERIPSIPLYVCRDAGAGNVIDPLRLHAEAQISRGRFLGCNPYTQLSIDLDG